jgi:hypothetical protein
MTVWVVGFDLSLTAPAAVALPLDWHPGTWKHVKAWLGRPPTPKGQDDLKGQLDRYIAIAQWASDCVRELGPASSKAIRCYVENYGFSANTANASRIQESGGAVKILLYQRFGLVLQPVTSSAARKLTLGFNPRRPKHDPKVAVQSAVFSFGAPKTWGENECDAFLVAQFGLSEEGGKILTLST